MRLPPIALCLLLAACTTQDPASINPGEDIATARAIYEAAGAKEVQIPLEPPEVNPSPNRTGTVRHYDYVAYEYEGKIVVIYYLDGKVTSISD